MNIFRKVAALATAATLFAGFGAASAGAQTLEAVKSRGTINVGMLVDFPPFGILDTSGQPDGYDADVAKLLAEDLGVNVNLVPVTGPNRIPYLLSGQVDVLVASLGITEERAKQIAFSDKYYDTPTGVIALKETEIQPSAEGIEGAYLGVSVGTIHETYARAHFSEAAADIRSYPTVDEELQDLAAGRIDAVVGDMLALMPFLESDAGEACCEYRGAVESDPSILGNGVGVGLRKEDTDLLERVNSGIAAIRENGTYDALSEPYFAGFDIYGS